MQKRRVLPDTCKHHLGAWNVGLGVEQVLEQVLLGPATALNNYGKTGMDIEMDKTQKAADEAQCSGSGNWYTKVR